MNARTVGMVGSGWIALRHIRAFQAKGIAIAAMLAPDRAQADRLCTQAGISPRLHAGLDDFLAEECGFYDVLVPPQVQPELVHRLLTRGRPVLCEKPLALSLAQGQALVAEAERQGTILAVMHNQLFQAAVVRAREIILSGEIGEPRLIRLHLVGHHIATTEWKRGLEARGGMIWDDCIHRLYVAESLFGAIRRVQARGVRDLAGPGAGWAGSVHLGFADGRMGVLDFSHGLGGGQFYDDSLAVIGTRGIVQVNGTFGQPWPMARCNVRVGDVWREEKVAGTWEDSFAGLLGHFLETVDSGRPSPLIGGRAALATVAAAEAIERSLREGGEITVGAVPPQGSS